jgi:aspartyl/asparaginyl beta-hydroxylase
MITSFKLPLTFDPLPLKADLAGIAPNDWVTHFNRKYFEGEWSGVALRSVGGNPKLLYPDPNSKDPVADTPLLAQCPNIRRVLEEFSCPVRSARLLKLTAGSRIREHRDYDLGFAAGEIRLHIPITTEDNVEFLLACERIEMKEGECWYLDFSQPHRVVNPGPADRVHLVVDCAVNDWLLRLFPADIATADSQSAHEAAEARSSPAELARFREAVLRDTDLQHHLRGTSDRKLFVSLVVKSGNAAGYRFSASDVEDEMKAARAAWIERWIE